MIRLALPTRFALPRVLLGRTYVHVRTYAHAPVLYVRLAQPLGFRELFPPRNGEAQQTIQLRQ